MPLPHDHSGNQDYLLKFPTRKVFFGLEAPEQIFRLDELIHLFPDTPRVAFDDIPQFDWGRSQYTQKRASKHLGLY